MHCYSPSMLITELKKLFYYSIITCSISLDVHMLTFMLVSLPTGWPLGDVGVSLFSTFPFDCCCWTEDAHGKISLITKSTFSSLSESSSASLHSWRGLWAWQSFWSKCGRWSSSMEMILWRCPLVSAGRDGWHDPLARFCFTELEGRSSSSSLQIQSNKAYSTHLTKQTKACTANSVAYVPFDTVLTEE